MDVTLEQIDALKKRANVSYEEARAALEGTEGDLLEALIILEREGKTKHRAAGYSTNGSVPQTFSEFGAGSGAGTGARHGGKKRGANQGAGSTDWQGQWQSDGWGGSDGSFSGNGSRHHGYAGVGEVLSQLWSAFMRLIARGNINHFEVFRHGKNVFSCPVTVLVLLLIIAFWFALPALVVGLFFGCRYRFRGPDLGKEGINRAMDSASETAENIKQSVKDAAQDAKDSAEAKAKDDTGTKA